MYFQGFGSVLNLLLRSEPEVKQVKLTLPEHSDAEAIRKDWEAVGNDIWNVAVDYKK